MIKKLDKELEKIFLGLPHLPKKAVEILVKITPYLVLVFGLFLITGGLRSIFGAKDFYRIFSFWKGIPPVYFYITGLLQILAGAVSLFIYQPLQNKELRGWFGLLCLTILELIMNLISVFFFRGGFFGLIFSLAISLYLLYEVKSEYGPVKSLIAKVKVVEQKVVKEIKKAKKK